eukprot:416587-Prymnesium_polylepis.1
MPRAPLAAAAARHGTWPTCHPRPTSRYRRSCDRRRRVRAWRGAARGVGRAPPTASVGGVRRPQQPLTCTLSRAPTLSRAGLAGRTGGPGACAPRARM